MILVRHSILHATVLLLSLGIIGCAHSGWPKSETKEAASTTSTANPKQASLDESRDLRLFGQGDISRELSFEVKAATDIQQHTSISEGADFDPSIDPSGKTIVFASTRHSTVSHLYLKSVEGATLTQITDGNSNDSQPCFSPDGRRIAFASDRAGQWDIWVVDRSGKNPVQITNTPAPELHPSWSPDGMRIVYCRLNSKDGRGELWISELDKPGMKRLIGDGLFPAWSPRGDHIAYQKARARGSRWFSIWTIELQENEAMYPTEVAASTTAALIAPTWSADGSQIAFSSVSPNRVAKEVDVQPRIAETGKADIAIIDSDGRGMQQLTNGRGENYSPCWSSDGRIYFTAKLNRTETIWSVKPFHPTAGPPMEPSATTGTRRAAEANDDTDSE